MGKGVQTGLVGFFDILGYKNLLEKNEPEKIAADVIPILTGAGDNVVNTMKSLLDTEEKSEEDKAKLTQKIELPNWLVFSDTVLITMSMNEANDWSLFTRWLNFLAFSIILQNQLFASGLPVRGAIDYGKFYIEQTCFAGRSIVNVYQICTQLEVAACVLSDTAAEQYKRVERIGKEKFNTQLHNVFVTDYLVPLKDREQHMLAVMAHSYDLDGVDIKRQVMNAFWGNNKDVPRDVLSKVNNTEQWLQFIDKKRSEKNLKTEATPPTPPI